MPGSYVSANQVGCFKNKRNRPCQRTPKLWGVVQSSRAF